MKKIVVFILILFLSPSIAFARNDIIEVEFSACIDGDTAKFLYDNKEIIVRFLAIDTPEVKHPTTPEQPYGKDASNYTCNTITDAKEIKLEFDSKSEELDKYNRYLAWVFTDNKNLQFELIKKGYAKVAYIYGDYKYLEELKNLETKAKYAKVGIWNEYNEPKDYTLYYIIGGILLLIIISSIAYNNKNLKKIANKSKTILNKNLNKLLKKYR